MALSTSVLAASDTVDLSYTSDGVLHNQTVTSGEWTYLDYPHVFPGAELFGKYSTDSYLMTEALSRPFKVTDHAALLTDNDRDPLQQDGIQVDAGDYTYDPGFNATMVLCLNPDQII
ncbi:uncharacterized protein AtWU_09242 [Aspergillus tubingensis]|uniref:Uncharacterized protein n=1 Tax=Aspergillus niger TaxID=5061 RepID=A0A100IT66_ASPNG|nr:uncharacterized protein AtWU_09242 [Aspergillus tubingensis]GAQ46885.1 hypothetical protein ABL_09546 [Aspergillus niger]GFN19438.1 hypothetical protein AtWU_09242 [Aspergillus tubingensis]